MKKVPEHYKQPVNVPLKVDPKTHKPGTPTMAHYIDASKEPRRRIKGISPIQRQARTFGKNG